MSDLRKSKNISAIHMLDDPDSMFKEGKEDSLAPSSGSLFVINFSSSVLHMFSRVYLLIFAIILFHLLVSFSCLILPVSIAPVLSSFFQPFVVNRCERFYTISQGTFASEHHIFHQICSFFDQILSRMSIISDIVIEHAVGNFSQEIILSNFS